MPEICEVTKLPAEVVELSLTAKGGSKALRKEAAMLEEEEEEEDVTALERKEMLGIIKGIARAESAENPAVALSAAKYVHGVAAGHYRRWDVNVDAHGLLLKINAAYEDANMRAFDALNNVTPPKVIDAPSSVAESPNPPAASPPNGAPAP